jgi:hypothetical protein
MRSPWLPMHARVALLLLVAPVALFAQTGDVERGVKFFEDGNYPAARSEFSAVLARNAREPNALYYMGRIAIAEGRTGEAVGWFEKAVETNDQSSEYHSGSPTRSGRKRSVPASCASHSSRGA